MHPLTSAALAALLTTGLATGPVAPPARADDATLPPGRVIRHHTVQPGETATGLAVRFHAWTAELVAHNHLGSAASLRVGQRLAIPVVRSAARGAAAGNARPPAGASGQPARERVRGHVATVARRQGVDPQLALAVSWQESGWQMHPVSGAGAIGAMQVLPSTARWMEYYAGRDLRPRRLHDNAVTGVTLLRVLAGSTRHRRRQLAAYYQGLGAVREHGLYDETRDYVADVLAIKRRLDRGVPPA